MNKRRKIFLNDALQILAIILVLLSVGSVFLLSGVGVYRLIERLLETIYELSPRSFEQILPFVSQTLVNITSLFLLLVAFLVGLALYTTHKISGPLYRIRADLEKMRSEKRIFEIKIRQTDRLHSFVREINAFLREVEFKK